MASITQVNGLSSLEVDYNFTTIKYFSCRLLSVTMADEIVDEGAIEYILREAQPLRYWAQQDGVNGQIYMWCEGTDAADLQNRIRAMGNSVGANNTDLTTAEVTERDILGNSV